MTDSPQYSWKTQPNPNQLGTQSATVVVTYADGSQDEVEVEILVKPLADKYTPNGKTITVNKNHNLDASDAARAVDVAIFAAEVQDIDWKTKPSTAAFSSDLDGQVNVRYKDGSVDVVDVRVNVLDDVIPVSTNLAQPDGYVKVEFRADSAKGSLAGELAYYVKAGATVSLTPPNVTPKTGFTPNGWNQNFPATFDQNVIIDAQFDEIVAVVAAPDPQPDGYVAVSFVSAPEK